MTLSPSCHKIESNASGSDAGAHRAVEELLGVTEAYSLSLSFSPERRGQNKN